MQVKHILLGCALAALSTNAIAADKTGRGYVGVGYVMLTLSPDGPVPDYDLSALGIRGGYYFNKYFSVEGRLGFGVGDDTQDDLTVDIDSTFGVYALGHLPLTEQFQLYGLIGFTQHDVTLSSPLFPGVEISDDDSDLSIGVGAEFDMTRNISLGLEYTSYFTDGEIIAGNYDTDGLGLFLNYNF